MNQLLVALSFVSQVMAAHGVQSINYDSGAIGRQVRISVDGDVQTTFAGRLSFHDGTHSWFSYCGDVHSPINEGQSFGIAVKSSTAEGGNVARAGNIVAKYFYLAQTPQQCAGLQLAVWKEIEDGTDGTDFRHGHFQAMADPQTMGYAQQFLQAADQSGDTYYLKAQGLGSGQGNRGAQQGNGGNGGQSQFGGPRGGGSGFGG